MCAVGTVNLLQHFPCRGNLPVYPVQRPCKRIRLWLRRQFQTSAVRADKVRPFFVSFPFAAPLAHLLVSETDISVDNRKCGTFCVVISQQVTYRMVSSFIFEPDFKSVFDFCIPYGNPSYNSP